MVTTVIGDDGAAILSDDAAEKSFRHRFSWSATFAGAVVGTAVIFFLLTLGSGVGLSLVPAAGVATKGFLTLGAIYFLAAQAMGFAAGGHLVGRLIGPMAETDREEEFRAAAHGLAVWGVCVSATALLVLMSSWVAAGSSAIAGGMALAPGNSSTAPTPAVSAYWTDVLFRPPPSPMHAALAWRQYAQANTPATDANPPTTDDEAPPTGNTGTTTTPMTPVPPTSGKVENDTSQNAAESHATQSPAPPHVITIPSATEENAASGAAPTPPAGRNIAADKAEVGRILETGMANGGSLSQYDHDRIAALVSQDTGLSTAESSRRVDNAQARIRSDQLKAAEAARKVARNASLWIAFALLFGAIVATMAAISARWQDDRITFGWPGRTEPA